MKLDPHQYNFMWVVDFPLFTEEDGIVVATHHPFTAAVPEDVHLLASTVSFLKNLNIYFTSCNINHVYGYIFIMIYRNV